MAAAQRWVVQGVQGVDVSLREVSGKSEQVTHPKSTELNAKLMCNADICNATKR